MEAYIFDSDGTLSDVKHRRHFVENGNNNWDKFFSKISEDAPIVPLVEFVKTLIHVKEKEIIFVTGRPEFTRKETIG